METCRSGGDAALKDFLSISGSLSTAYNLDTPIVTVTVKP